MRDREKPYSRILALTALILLLILASSTASAVQSNLTITRITTSGSALDPSIDSDRIVYSDYRNGKCQICMYNLSTSEETVISSSRVSVFSPDIYEDRIIWCEEFKKDSNVVNDLINYLTTSIRKIMEFIIRFELGSMNLDDVKYNIWLYNLSTQEKTRIITSESVQTAPEIYGDNVVWGGSSEIDGTQDLYLYNLSTHRKTQTTTSGSAISPIIYGDRIIYDDFSSGEHEIYMYDLSLSREIPFPKNDSWQGAYAIHEDKIVIFHTEDEKTTDIYLHDFSTRQETKIITSGFATSPAIYGDRIVWTSQPYDTVNPNIYMYDFSTEKQTQITTSGSAFDPIIYGDTIVWQDRQWEDKRNGREIDDVYMCTLNLTVPPVTASSESRMSGKLWASVFTFNPENIQKEKISFIPFLILKKILKING